MYPNHQKPPGLSVVHHILPMFPLSRFCPMVHTELAFLRTGRKMHDKWLRLASAWHIWKAGYKIILHGERTSSFLIYFTKGEAALISLGSFSSPAKVHQQKPLDSPHLGIKPWEKVGLLTGKTLTTEVEKDVDVCTLLVLRRRVQILRWSPWTSCIMALQASTWDPGTNMLLGSHFHLVRRKGWGCRGALDSPLIVILFDFILF